MKRNNQVEWRAGFPKAASVCQSSKLALAPGKVLGQSWGLILLWRQKLHRLVRWREGKTLGAANERMNGKRCVKIEKGVGRNCIVGDRCGADGI